MPPPSASSSSAYYSLPSQSPPSPLSPSSPAPIVVSRSPTKSRRPAVPRKLDATGVVRSDTLDRTVSEVAQDGKTALRQRGAGGVVVSAPVATAPAAKKWSFFGLSEKNPPVVQRAVSVRKDSSGSDSSGYVSEKEQERPSAPRRSNSKYSTSTSPPSKRGDATMSGNNSGYFEGAVYGSSNGFERFPPQSFSPPDSDDADAPEVPKSSWFSNLFASKKDKEVEEQQQQQRARYGNSSRPPSPPTSIRSTTPSVNTLRPNVNRSTVSLGYNSAYGGTSPPSSSTPTNVASTPGTGANSNTWAFWSRVSSKGDKSGNAISEDGVVAFTGPSAKSFIQKQRGRMDDNASVMSSETTVPILTSKSSANLSRKSSRVSLANPGYPASVYSVTGPTDGASIYNSNLNGSTSKINRQQSYRKDKDRHPSDDSRSFRTIEAIGKPKPDMTTVKSASGAKETVFMAPPPTNGPAVAAVGAEPAVPAIAPAKKGKKKKEEQIRYPNMVVPTLEECLAPGSSGASLWGSFERWFSAATESDEEKHLRLQVITPPRIKKAVAIGIHGFFPIRMVRSIIGEPTGTSVKFANEAAMGIQRWADAHGQDIEIEKIALEGEGIVLDRVENLYRLLSNWMDHLHQADFILVAAHSQGTPVAVQLVAKLIEEGHADNKKIGIVGMAGVSLGPFYGLDQKLVMRAYTPFESDSLKELFAFQNPNSLQARRYIQGMRTVIAHGVKIAYVGSVNDQLVPLYSSLCVHINHPSIFRAVYVDGKAHAPSFIVHLIELLAKLRNMGYSDHGIVRDISDAMAGTLTGGGHSNIYNEHGVYDIAIRHALETSDIPDVPVHVDDRFEVPMPSNYNPYHLPWSVRGMFEQDFVRKHLTPDVTRVLDLFDEWNPDTKPLKEIKYRLSAIRKPEGRGTVLATPGAEFTGVA
ncbi:uncharacterized protein V1518DRAFT_423549 [Limtongia smithiae]|uniref:uncharacterized protein n=1 Tax=Limtongia smithiae TaxID=1125753 RepID=UPI0034CEA40F